MKYLLAPSDFCIPMMLVRSFTETNIMLAMPKPPTSMEKPPITQPTTAITENKLSNPWVSRLVSLMEKSSSAKGFRR